MSVHVYRRLFVLVRTKYMNLHFLDRLVLCYIKFIFHKCKIHFINHKTLKIEVSKCIMPLILEIFLSRYFFTRSTLKT
jgi:hypothetical protein